MGCMFTGFGKSLNAHSNPERVDNHWVLKQLQAACLPVGQARIRGQVMKCEFDSHFHDPARIISEQIALIKHRQQRLEALQSSFLAYRKMFRRLARRYLQARYDSYHDELTGLPNRRLFEDRLKQAILNSERHNKAIALLFLDLDRFKEINDTFGHAIGDQILQQVAGRLNAVIRRGDTVCRYGGDEFIILLSELESPEGGDVVIGKIRQHLDTPYHLNGRDMKISMSIGIATYLAKDRAKDELIHLADLDMYQDKQRNRQSLQRSG